MFPPVPPQIRTHAYPSAGSTGILIQTTEQRKLNTGARHPEPDPIARTASAPRTLNLELPPHWIIAEPAHLRRRH